MSTYQSDGETFEYGETANQSAGDRREGSKIYRLKVLSPAMAGIQGCNPQNHVPITCLLADTTCIYMHLPGRILLFTPNYLCLNGPLYLSLYQLMLIF